MDIIINFFFHLFSFSIYETLEWKHIIPIQTKEFESLNSSIFKKIYEWKQNINFSFPCTKYELMTYSLTSKGKEEEGNERNEILHMFDFWKNWEKVPKENREKVGDKENKKNKIE